jgi:hypothetical protein
MCGGNVHARRTVTIRITQGAVCRIRDGQKSISRNCDCAAAAGAERGGCEYVQNLRGWECNLGGDRTAMRDWVLGGSWSL